MVRHCAQLTLDAAFRLRSWLYREHTPGVPSSAGLSNETIASNHQLTLGWLRARLRKFPYWRKGHLHFAGIALEMKLYDQAYASAHAALALASRKDACWMERWYLGKCHLGSGAALQSEEELRAAARLRPESPQIAEDLAAALMAQGKENEALAVLSKFGAGALSAQGRAALDYVRGDWRSDS